MLSYLPFNPLNPTTMPFRTKVKKAFRREKASNSDPDSGAGPPRSDIETYPPGSIPSSKYRGPWNQQHQDALQAFSFEDAFGAENGAMTPSYSPRGRLAQSRTASWAERARLSLGGGGKGGEGGGGRERSEVVRDGSGVGADGEAHNINGHADISNSKPPGFRAGHATRPHSYVLTYSQSAFHDPPPPPRTEILKKRTSRSCS